MFKRKTIPPTEKEYPIVETTFGDLIDISKDMPPGTDAIIVGIYKGHQLEVKRVLLPHQLYTKTFEELIEEADYPYKDEIVVIPYRSREDITIQKI